MHYGEAVLLICDAEPLGPPLPPQLGNVGRAHLCVFAEARWRTGVRESHTKLPWCTSFGAYIKKGEQVRGVDTGGLGCSLTQKAAF